MKHRLSKFSNQDIMFFETEDSDDCLTARMVQSQNSPIVIIENEGEIPLVIFNGKIRKNAWVTQDHVIALEAKAIGAIVGECPKKILKEKGYYNAFKILNENLEVV